MRKLFLIIKLIWQGWKNYVIDLISDIRYKKYFDERYKVCKACEYNQLTICQKCGCFTKAKTMAEDAECPVGKWQTIPETLMREKINGKAKN
jgi:hypothetical protein